MPLQHFFESCPALRFDPPFDFLSPDDRCRATVSDPARVLAELLNLFSEEELLGCSLLRRRKDGARELCPALLNPCGAVVALRPADDAPPAALLTARGLLSGETSPVLSALEDSRTSQLAAECGVLLVAESIRDVVLLQSLGLPATLASGWGRLGLGELRLLSEQFDPLGQLEAAAPDFWERARAAPVPEDELETSTAAEDAAPPDVGVPFPERVPDLVLVGWRPSRLTAGIPNWVSRAATRFAELSSRLGLELNGISVWRPGLEWIESLRYRLSWREPELVRELLFESLDEDECQLEDLISTPPLPEQELHLFEAQRNLVMTLAGEPSPSTLDGREELERAYAAYERAVDQRLIKPLVSWASKHHDRLARNAGFQLAVVAELLHRASPSMQALQRRLQTPGGLGTALPPPDQLTPYLTVLDRFCQLLKSISALFPIR